MYNDWLKTLTEKQLMVLAYQSGMKEWATYPTISRLEKSAKAKAIFEEHYGQKTNIPVQPGTQD